MAGLSDILAGVPRVCTTICWTLDRISKSVQHIVVHTCGTPANMLDTLRNAIEWFQPTSSHRNCTLQHCASECQICLRSPQNDMIYQLYAMIWSRNGVGLTCMGPYRHADAVDSVRPTCEVIRTCRYSARKSIAPPVLRCFSAHNLQSQ